MQHEEGYEAYWRNLSLAANSYDYWCELTEYEDWRNGWLDGYEDDN